MPRPHRADWICIRISRHMLGLGLPALGLSARRFRTYSKTPRGIHEVFDMESGDVLSSRAVAHRVLSALRGLTSVFGMGTGGPSRHNHRAISKASYLQNRITINQKISKGQFGSSTRQISTGQLHALLHFHLRPINLVVFKVS